MSEIPVLVSTQATCLIDVTPHPNVAENAADMKTKGNMNVYQGRTIHITIANFSMVDAHLTKHQEVGKTTNGPKEIVHIKYKLFSYPSGTHANNSDGSVPAVQQKPTQDRLD